MLIVYNKKILDRLNIKKNDFKIYEMLKEFNEEYNLNVDDIDNKELDLIGKYIGKEGLGYLNTLGFKQLSVFANILAELVLPVPRGPVNI